MSPTPSSGKKFSRRTENFQCESCGAAVQGDGYTNHCPQCLASKHVDVNPGDRAADCGGLMRPIAVEKEGEGYRVLFECEKCGFRRPNRTRPEDMEAVIRLTKRLAREAPVRK